MSKYKDVMTAIKECFISSDDKKTCESIQMLEKYEVHQIFAPIQDGKKLAPIAKKK